MNIPSFHNVLFKKIFNHSSKSTNWLFCQKKSSSSDHLINEISFPISIIDNEYQKQKKNKDFQGDQMFPKKLMINFISTFNNNSFKFSSRKNNFATRNF